MSDNIIRHLDKAKELMNAGAMNKADIELCFAEKLNPENSEVLFERGKYYLQRSDYQNASASFRKSLENNPEHPYAELLLAESLMASKNYGESYKIFKKLSEKPHISNKAEESLNKLRAMAETPNLDASAADSFISAGVVFAETLISLGDSSFKNNDPLRASDFYRRAFIVSKKNDDPYYINRALNRLEISQKKVSLESKPRWLEICLSSRCNLKCRMCLTRRRDWKLPKKIINEIISLGPLLENITWYGGEVLFLEEFPRIYNTLRLNPRLRQHIVTNGVLIDSKWAELFAREKTHITYSIDGIMPATYEKIREGSSFQKLIESINLMNKFSSAYKADSLLSMNFVLMRSNFRELSLIPDFLDKYNFSRLSIVPMTTLQKGDSENLFEGADDKDLRELRGILSETYAECRRLGIEVHEWYFSETNKPDDAEPAKAQDIPVCLKPWTKLQICEGGDVIPEQFCTEPVGNLADYSLSQIWNSSRMRNFRTSLLNETEDHLCSPECLLNYKKRRLNEF